MKRNAFASSVTTSFIRVKLLPTISRVKYNVNILISKNVLSSIFFALFLHFKKYKMILYVQSTKFASRASSEINRIVSLFLHESSPACCPITALIMHLKCTAVLRFCISRTGVPGTLVLRFNAGKIQIEQSEAEPLRKLK